MFSLIITIIAIALVAALALASLYFGGSSFIKGGDEAKVSRILNEGQQIKGAFTLFRAETGETAEGLTQLVAQSYLKAAPDGWDVSAGYSFHVENSQEVCLAANKRVGIEGIPTCADATYADKTVCCSTPESTES